MAARMLVAAAVAAVRCSQPRRVPSARRSPRTTSRRSGPRGDGPIREPRDLEGRTLAVNTLDNIAEVTALEALSAEGVDVDSIELTEVPFPDMQAPVENGEVDAAFFIEPFSTLAEEAGAELIAGADRGVDRPGRGLLPPGASRDRRADARAGRARRAPGVAGGERSRVARAARGADGEVRRDQAAAAGRGAPPAG